MGAVLDLSEQLWTGKTNTYENHPFMALNEYDVVAERTIFYNSFAGVTAFGTDDGLVMVDTGLFALQEAVFGAVRSWSRDRLNTAIFTHGHVDHIFTVPLFQAEAKERGWTPPRVVAHEDVPRRFDRYIMTAGYNGVINQRQFAQPVTWPTSYSYPDVTYRNAMTLKIGGLTFELNHARGETDDHTWVWVPEREVLCSGDLIIWAVPNAGNPQKVQRYCAEWAAALRKMAGLKAKVLCPGHGVVVVGRDRVEHILSDTAELLESIHTQALALMNEGATLDRVIHSVEVPEHLKKRPYLQPVYDEPQYIVRNIWRLYGGWYDGNPAHVKPAPEAAQAAEIAALAGGVSALVKRAKELAKEGDLRLACHLIEWAFAAAPTNKSVNKARAEIYEKRAATETALMTMNIYNAAARESRATLD
ncbi:MAG: MBL fold metallo-hydrolase [Candidatus Abyssobacteria bacterium SURF_5]|uniref:MBL fold metallo-hydrolase n=1 Tax=Abyssobacteria bacterium (strain SURF_5) TaxID=2093360 RepID=A0A3A4NWB9_ABYX5|nr:MAG: MBL fold metallo-hydrolase [Candidatus Abyssubacteria bacterium SURF_5]